MTIGVYEEAMTIRKGKGKLHLTDGDVPNERSGGRQLKTLCGRWLTLYSPTLQEATDTRCVHCERINEKLDG